MEKGGYAAVNVFRKHLSAHSKKSRWATVVRTPAQIEADERKLQRAEDDKEESEEEMVVEKEKVTTTSTKVSSAAELADMMSGV